LGKVLLIPGNDFGFGPLIARFWKHLGHDRGKEVDEWIGQEHQDKSESQESQNEASAVEDLVFHPGNEVKGDLDFLKDGVDGDVEGVPEEIAEALLKEHDGQLGEGVRDPAGGKGKGDVCAEADGSQGGQNHLSGNGELGNKEPNRQPRSDGIPAGMPKFTMEHGDDNFSQPSMSLQTRTPESTIGLPDETEIADFEVVAHGAAEKKETGEVCRQPTGLSSLTEVRQIL